MIADFISTMLSRRSIRQYSEQEVSKEDLAIILEAGFAAPSARNRRPWHFITVSDKKLLNKLANSHPYGKMLSKARVAIVVCGEISKEERERYFWLLDGAAATENMLLAAHALGLGAVWLGVYDRQEREDGFRQILNIPPEIGVLSAISLGYPAEEKEAHSGTMPGRVHPESW